MKQGDLFSVAWTEDREKSHRIFLKLMISMRISYGNDANFFYFCRMAKNVSYFSNYLLLNV